MGREVRRVPSNWEHPRYTEEDSGYNKIGSYRPLINCNFDKDFEEWLEDFDKIRAGEMTDLYREFYPRGLCEWLTDYRPPNPEDYVNFNGDDATWFQSYETVSEGTPVTPPFQTKEELIEYLVNNGDFWDQMRGHGGWEREAAEKFVSNEFAPSGIMCNGNFFAPRDGVPE